jgi:hypothetical protein
LKRQAEETPQAGAEAAAWKKVRQALYRPEEPWWWLRLIGCKDPQGFYTRHGLAPEGAAKGAAAEPEVSAGDISDVRELGAAVNYYAAAPATYPEMEAATEDVVPVSSRPVGGTATTGAAEVSYKEDSYDFDEGNEAGPTGSAKLDKDEADEYGDEFDTEGDISPVKDAGSPATPGGPERTYSQDDFENDYERSNVKREYSEFEADPAPAVYKEAAPTFENEFEADFEPAEPENVEVPGEPGASPMNYDQFEADEATFEGATPGKPPLDSKYSTDGFDFEADESMGRQMSKYSNGDFEFEPDDSPAGIAKSAVTVAESKYAQEDEFEEDEFEED